MELCERAANEHDSEKLHQLIAEIDRQLKEKLARLKPTPDTPPNSP